MFFVERPADAFLAEWSARRDGPRLVTVHGLGGSGTSTSVARALADRSFVRVDLGGAAEPAAVRARLQNLRESEIVFVDQVHRPRAARAAIEALLERTPAQVIVSARAPLGAEREHRVPLGLLDELARSRRALVRCCRRSRSRTRSSTRRT
jgi:hypothetical protein